MKYLLYLISLTFVYAQGSIHKDFNVCQKDCYFADVATKSNARFHKLVDIKEVELSPETLIIKPSPLPVEEIKPITLPKKEEPKIKFQNGYYIQVAALFKLTEPDDNFKNKVKNAGYKCTMISDTIRDTKFIRVVIGPYNKKLLRKNLKIIRSKISKDAHIMMLKDK